MNYKSDIESLKRELADKEFKQRQLERNCIHEWLPTKYDPEEYQEPVFSHHEPHGSDLTLIYNYHTAQKARWSRECRICGKKECTYEQVPTKYEPKF